MSTQEPTSPDTMSNENLSVTTTKKPHCQIKFDIQVTPKAVDAAYFKAFKNVSREVSIPGFRKGKAPESLLLEKYQSVIQKEFVDVALQTAFNEAVQLTHLHPLRDGHMKRPVIHECSREKGAHFTIEFEARPTIPSIQLEDLHIQKAPIIPITDQEKENALQNLLFQFATYEPIQDRPVQENDFIDVSVLILKEPPHEVVQKQRTQVNDSGLPSWLREKVLGLGAGESAEGMTEQDSKLPEPDPDYQSLPFRVTVHAIWQGTLPSLDDELAKRVGLQTLDELHRKINERLEQEVKEEASKQDIQAIENLLLETYPIDLPQSYIDANKEARMNDYLKDLEAKGSKYNAEDMKQMDSMIEQNTIQQLQLFFLLRKIAADYTIKVENQDISQELSRQIALMSSGRSSLIDVSDDKQQLQEQLQNLALDRKIKHFLLDHVGDQNK